MTERLKIYSKLLPGHKVRDFTYCVKVVWLDSSLSSWLKMMKNRDLSNFLFLLSRGRFGKLVNMMRAKISEWRGCERVSHMPYSMLVEPSSICQLKCPLCPTVNPASEIKPRHFDIETYKKLMAVFGPKLISVHLNGKGEPFLNPALPEMVRVARSYNVFTYSSSNLNHMPEGMAEEIVGSGLNHLIVSIDGATKETYEKYRVGGNFETVIRNLAALIDAKKRLASRTPFIEWQFLLMKDTEHELLAACNMARDMGCDSFLVRAAIDCVAGNGEVDASLETADYRSLVYVGTTAERRCAVPWDTVRFWADGSADLCGCDGTKVFGAAAVTPESFPMIWNNVFYRRARRAVAESARGVRRPDPGASHPCARCVNMGRYNRGL